MKLALSRRMALWIGLVAVLSLGARRAPERIHVILLHTNDLHGQVQPRKATWLDREAPPRIGGLPRLAAYTRQVRQAAAEEGSGVLLVDGGDWFQGTPEGLLEEGRAFAAALGEVGYDGLTLGNHELDHGLESLEALLATAGLPAVCANIREAEGGARPDWCQPWRVVEVAGLRVALVGLLTPVTPTITHPDASQLDFQEPAEALAEARAALAGEVDWVLPLTHLGVRDDRRLAKAHPDLPVIVGGHSHTYLKEGIRQGETWILQSGSKASAVGRLDLWFDGETKELVETRYELVDLLEEPAPEHRNARVDELCADLSRRAEASMSAVVGELAEPLERHFRLTHSSPSGNLITDVMRERLDADVAVQNRGGIRCDLAGGEVTRRDLFELLPFGNHLVLLELDGEELLGLLRASVEGTAHTGLEVSGLTVRWSQGEGAEGPTLVGLEVGGEPVVPGKTYRLATNNFLAGGGDGYALLEGQPVLREDPVLMRELLEEHFRAAGTVHPLHEDRYEETQP